jgi:hypothetical protein
MLRYTVHALPLLLEILSACSAAFCYQQIPAVCKSDIAITLVQKYHRIVLTLMIGCISCLDAVHISWLLGVLGPIVFPKHSLRTEWLKKWYWDEL